MGRRQGQGRVDPIANGSYDTLVLQPDWSLAMDLGAPSPREE